MQQNRNPRRKENLFPFLLLKNVCKISMIRDSCYSPGTFIRRVFSPVAKWEPVGVFSKVGWRLVRRSGGQGDTCRWKLSLAEQHEGPSSSPVLEPRRLSLGPVACSVTVPAPPGRPFLPVPREVQAGSQHPQACHRPFLASGEPVGHSARRPFPGPLRAAFLREAP